ncbi:MAG: glycosyl hydrolase family 39 [Sphingobacteriales bacterium]|nr:MAG: glycosyl hydrolase family 39 [Sphingobacteriales bacterium]
MAQVITGCSGGSKPSGADSSEYNVAINWDKVESVLKTELSIQICPEPPMRRGHPASKGIYKALRDAKVNYARYQPWYPFPRLGVAELEPPKDGKTSWDFSVIDPMVIDFFEASEGRPVVVDFSTIPQWMIVTDKPVKYPDDPNAIHWDYSPGNKFRDTTLKEIVDYYHRLLSWYTKGGFTDEYGKYHQSGHHFKIDYWEVLNENDQDTQHLFSPEELTKIYDAIVADLSKLNPDMKFSGLALAFPEKGDKYVEHFLNPKNHKPGIPVDMFSYHQYIGSADTAWKKDPAELEKQQYAYFSNIDNFLKTVNRLDTIKKRLAPNVKTYINELGSLPPGGASDPKVVIPDNYWVLSSAMFAYAYVGVVKTGIDVLGIAELIDYPGQFAGTTIVHWDTGIPNARYWGMKLLHDNIGKDAKVVASGPQHKDLLSQGFITSKGERKILLVNKTGRVLKPSVPGANGAKMEYVDLSTGSKPAATKTLAADLVELQPHAVAVITLQ